MAEALAFNQTIGYAGSDPIRGEMLKYISFYRKNRELFVGTRDLAPVGLLRSYPSIAYHQARAQLSAILAEQALIQSRIPFELVFDDHLKDLSRYRVLVLPDSECLSDEQLASIRQFVANGGGLVAIGQSGLYDPWRRLRVEPGLKGLVDNQRAARPYEENPEKVQIAGAAVRREVGKGRTVYLPELRFDGLVPEMEPYFTISNRFWKLPANAKELSDGIAWAANNDLPVTVTGPLFLVANLVEQPDQSRWLLHLVNYNARREPSIGPIEVRCRLPRGAVPKAIQVISPDQETATLPAAAAFTVPGIKTYSIVSVSW
jgi:hypothetical protein